VNRQPRDHEIGDAPAPSGRAGDRKPALQPVRRPVLQGHVVQRHLLGGRLAASRAAAPPAPLIEGA
jgi:hypothetical protein